MVVLVSTEARRVVTGLGGGAFVGAILWIVRVTTGGLARFLASVGILVVGALLLAFIVSTLVEARIDRKARTRLSNRLDPTAQGTVSGSDRCVHCRRPLVTANGVTICATCDQKPSL